MDILALTNNWAQEGLKRRLVEKDSRFFTVASKNPTATYRVLWFRTSDSWYGEKCKVDLLQPGVMNIPHVATKHIEEIDGIPVAPFSLVLLLKLQAWKDHKAAMKAYLCMKQHTDVADINRLLPIACAREIHPRNDCGIPMDFIYKTEVRVKEYVERFPESRSGWKTLGFEAEEKRPILLPSVKIE